MRKTKVPLLLISASDQDTQQDTIAGLCHFLLRYSFLLNDTTELQNSCDQKTPQLNALQGNIYMGARYLDPKYSRWISVDPALAEYVPGAGKSDEADKLPGMGGVFNSVNLSLFHYAGNNPVRYLDPDGRLVTSDDCSTNDMILDDIQLSAGNGFYFDENSVLQIDEAENPGSNYSPELRNDLISLIKGENKDVKVSLLYSEKYTRHQLDGDGICHSSVVDNTGRVLFGDRNGESYRVAIPSYVNNPNGERTALFIHEFKGHLIPSINGKTSGNAVYETMPIIDSLGLKILSGLIDYWRGDIASTHDGPLTSVEIDGWLTK